MSLLALVRLNWSDSSGRTYRVRLPRYAAYELAEALVSRCAIPDVTLDLGNRLTVCTIEPQHGGFRWIDPASGPVGRIA